MRVAILLTAALLSTGALAQDFDAITIQLDKMTKADWTAIQRGNGETEWQCLQDALAEAKKMRIPASETYVTFEDPDTMGVTVSFVDTDSNYVCEEGEMRSYEVDDYQVIRSYR